MFLRMKRSEQFAHSAFSLFSQAIKEARIPLQLGMAAEVRLDPVIMSMAESGTLPLLGNDGLFDILLLEFPHENIPLGSDKIVDWLLERHIKPMIAHPERNRSVLGDIEKITPFVKAGCLLQITSGSLTGVFGDGPMIRAKELLQRGWVSIIASDAHNRQTRPPEIEPGRAIAEEIVGESASWCMVRDKPLTIAAQQFSDLS